MKEKKQILTDIRQKREVSREEKEHLKNNGFNFVVCERACHKTPDRQLPELSFERGNMNEGRNMQKANENNWK